MSLFAPDYYKKFKCIADKCNNNCCIGWEIDIDENTLGVYANNSEISEYIEFTPTPHFKLSHNERCPFLNSDNLCEIIKNYGEENLCQICTDHPRFRNFFDSRTEIGLGMCCEAATDIILNNDFKLIALKNETQKNVNEEENDFFDYRNQIFTHKPEDFLHLLPDLSLNDIFETMMQLEKLSDTRDEIIYSLKNRDKKINKIELFDSVAFKRIFDYYVFRHLHSENLEFCTLCTYIIAALGENIRENARMFSAEIEYSDQNIDILYNLI